MKRLVTIMLAFTLLLGVTTALAIEKGASRAVIGADLTAEQRQSVYKSFGVEQGSVPELSVSNDEERRYLDGLVDSAIIGTHSISCVYIEVLGQGEGLDVSVSNISWCTKGMYINALITAGIDDAKVVVTSPIQGISGTAALTGIYKAYEDISGEKLDEVAKLAGTQELVITAELADEIGSYDAVVIVNELKKILDQTVNMTDSELISEIDNLAEQYDVSVSDGQKQQLVSLCRSLEKLDPQQLKEKVESVQDTILKLSRAKETVANVSESVKKFFEAVSEFFSNLFSQINK